jgi:hypothetical protein
MYRERTDGDRKKKLIIAVEVFSHAEKFDCEKCPWGRHCDEDGRWPDSRGPAAHKKFVIVGVIESKTCFLPMVTPQSRFLVELHSHYQNRLLPYDGGLLTQPNYYRTAMEIVSGAHYRARKK